MQRNRHPAHAYRESDSLAAMWSLAAPSAACNNTFARATCRCGAVCDHDSFSNIERSASDIFNGFAGRFAT